MVNLCVLQKKSTRNRERIWRAVTRHSSTTTRQSRRRRHRRCVRHVAPASVPSAVAPTMGCRHRHRNTAWRHRATRQTSRPDEAECDGCRLLVSSVHVFFFFLLKLVHVSFCLMTLAMSHNRWPLFADSWILLPNMRDYICYLEDWHYQVRPVMLRSFCS